ncbi:MAG TPA: 4'-phosphopantetheinyl transferase superfamily protein [Streptomyces sp.]|uniref:4'-phosphopantetheinyl transferase family protein n=1 Tax=Streptomyces sp. TaxID=1931 RepID=UPI002D275018|nr:4'-phosphopantetheinyl transferase superfamily protein [Streptomyces sp.]HZG05803.1 4'-phosphopantetheinyl transferase superfamily protein [Streptomyces sp.]
MPPRRPAVPAVPRQDRPLPARLLPSWAGCAELTSDPEPPVLFPEEEELVARAGAGRRGEFGAGRLCARRAMAALGLPGVALPRGRRGMPAWPAGVVGSITHCDGYRAAAVARSRDAVALGLDAEPDAPLPAGVLEAVAFGAEREWLAEYRERHPAVSWDRLLFSAKEAVYKAWCSAGGSWLGFEDAEVTAAPEGGTRRGTFRARLTAAPAGVPVPRLLHGRWLSHRGLLVTAVVVT